MPESAASPTADERTVTVVGQGKANATPDTALLRLGVETRAANPAQALDGCGRRASASRAVRRPGWCCVGPGSADRQVAVAELAELAGTVRVAEADRRH